MHIYVIYIAQHVTMTLAPQQILLPMLVRGFLIHADNKVVVQQLDVQGSNLQDRTHRTAATYLC